MSEIRAMVLSLVLAGCSGANTEAPVEPAEVVSEEPSRAVLATPAPLPAANVEPTPLPPAEVLPEPVPPTTPAAAQQAPSPAAKKPDVATEVVAEPVAVQPEVKEPEVAQPEPEQPVEEPAEQRGLTSYAVVPADTWIYVVVRFDPDALAVALGHDHMVRAVGYQSTLRWNPESAEDCDVSFVIPVADLVPDPPGGRERAGLDPLDAVGKKALGSIKSNFLAKKQLHADAYPEIRFQSTSCDGVSGPVRVKGDLSMRGVTNPISLRMEVEEDGETFRATGRFETTHTAFGFKPFSNMAGAFRNLDTLSFTVDVAAKAR
ncbi:MAG: YceI family protein [Proteobacteria bacterium]|nr:YceI family protein [Pseudomonadota bacterium]